MMQALRAASDKRRVLWHFEHELKTQHATLVGSLTRGTSDNLEVRSISRFARRASSLRGRLFDHRRLLPCLTYLFTYLLTYFVTYLRTYFVTYLLRYLLTYLLTYFLTYLLTYLLTDFLTYLPTRLRTYLPF
jgi:hypothetical protein